MPKNCTRYNYKYNFKSCHFFLYLSFKLNDFLLHILKKNSKDFSLSNWIAHFCRVIRTFSFGKYSKTKIMHITRLTIMKLMIKSSWFFSEIKAYVSDHCHQKTNFQWNTKCLSINMPVMVQLLKMWLWLVNTYNLIFEISSKKSFSFLRQWAICYNIILHVSWKYSIL